MWWLQVFGRKSIRKKRPIMFSSSTTAIMFLASVLFLIYPDVNSLCVWERGGDGTKLACGFRKSGLLRLRNFGGVKSWAGLGFSVGDEDGFKLSLTNMEKVQAEEGRSNSKLGSNSGIGQSEITYFKNDDENSDEIPEDIRRYGKPRFAELLKTALPTSQSSPSTSSSGATGPGKPSSLVSATASLITPDKKKSTKSPAKPIENSSLEKRTLSLTNRGGRSENGLNGSLSSTVDPENIKKMIVSVNIPAFEPMPELQLSSVKVSSGEADTVDKYMNTTTTTTLPPPKVDLKTIYKKTKKANNSRKNPFRVQLLENTEHIVDGYKQKDSTLLVPANEKSKLKHRAQRQHENLKLSEALLRIHSGNGKIGTGEDSEEYDRFTDTSARNPDRSLAIPSPIHPKDLQIFYSKFPHLKHLTAPQVEQHLMDARRPNPHELGKNRMPGHQRNPDHGSRPHHFLRPHPSHHPFPPPLNRMPRPQPSGGPPIRPTPMHFSKEQNAPAPRPSPSALPRKFPPLPRTINGKPIPPNSIVLPLSVLKKYIPKALLPSKQHHHRHNPGMPKPRVPPMNMPPQHQFQPPVVRRPIPPRPQEPELKEPHISGSINHYHRNHPSQSAEHNLRHPPSSHEMVILPVPLPMNPLPGPPPPPPPGNRERFQPHSSQSRLPQLPPALPSYLPSPTSIYNQSYHQEMHQIVQEKATILNALKTLSKAKAEMIKEIVKDGSLPQGVINVVSTSKDAGKPPNPTTHIDFVPRPSDSPYPLRSSIEKESRYPPNPPSKHVPPMQSSDHPPAEAYSDDMYDEEQAGSIHSGAYAQSVEIASPNRVPIQHDNVSGPQEYSEERIDKSKVYTEKFNSISSKLAELPDNEEFITLPIDDVLSMLTATMTGSGETSSKEPSSSHSKAHGGSSKTLTASQEDAELKSTTRQSELGRILYDMGIIHRIAAGNLTYQQMEIVNRLIDLNQNEQRMDESEYEGSFDDYYSDEVLSTTSTTRKPPTKYNIPPPTIPTTMLTTKRPMTTITASTTRQPENSWRPLARVKTTPTEPSIKEIKVNNVRSKAPPPIQYTAFPSKSAEKFRPSRPPTVVSEMVQAALQEYTSNQRRNNNNKNNNQNEFSRRSGQLNSPKVIQYQKQGDNAFRTAPRITEIPIRPSEFTQTDPDGISRRRIIASATRTRLNDNEPGLLRSNQRSQTRRKKPNRESSSAQEVVVIRPTAKPKSRPSPTQPTRYRSQQTQSSSAPAVATSPVFVDLDDLLSTSGGRASRSSSSRARFVPPRADYNRGRSTNSGIINSSSHINRNYNSHYRMQYFTTGSGPISATPTRPTMVNLDDILL